MNITPKEILLEEQRTRNINRGYERMSAYIYFFSVNKVNIEERTIDIEFLSSGTIERGIKYTSSFIGNDMGIDFIPRVGDIGIATNTAVGAKIVIGFLYNGSKSRSGKMSEGDIVTMSSGKAYMREDDSGNISIISKSGAGMMVHSDGSITVTGDTSFISTYAKEYKEFFSDNNKCIVENIFKEKPESTISAADIAKKIALGEPIEIKSRTPIISTFQISQKDVFGNPVQMDNRFDSASNIVYKKQINSDLGDEVFSLSVDEVGNTLIKCRKFFVEETHPVNLSGKGTANGTQTIVYHPFLNSLSTVIIVVSDSAGTWEVTPEQGRFVINSTEPETDVSFEWFVER